MLQARGSSAFAAGTKCWVSVSMIHITLNPNANRRRVWGFCLS